MAQPRTQLTARARCRLKVDDHIETLTGAARQEDMAKQEEQKKVAEAEKEVGKARRKEVQNAHPQLGHRQHPSHL